MAATVNANSLKIGELTKITGLSERSLRHYEDLGILTPKRTEGGTRYYSERDVALAKLVQSMRGLDIPLEVITSISNVRGSHSSGASSSKDVATKLNKLSCELMLMARVAIELQCEIGNVLSAVNECRNCPNEPSSTGCPDCPMNTAAGQFPLADMIWRG